MFFLVIFIFTCAAKAGLSLNVSNSCPSMCKCTPEETILCNRAGLKTLPGEIAPSTISLNLSNNYLRILNTNTFRNLTFLHSLWLDGNNLTFLTPGTFHALSRLQELHLSRNSRLTYLHANTFRGLLNLISLDLNLYLNNNQISSISNSAFLYLNKLHFLHLSRNNLSSLPVGLFSSLPRLRYVFLSHNPWSCDCSALWLRRWTAALLQGLDCAFPGPANSTAAQSSVPAKFQCHSPHSASLQLLGDTDQPSLSSQMEFSICAGILKALIQCLLGAHRRKQRNVC
uniref:Uncharacterized protein n=1 Tax=Geospiza parvula TaxID=87175 RepID=A0A8C3NBF4_GEOPR